MTKIHTPEMYASLSDQEAQDYAANLAIAWTGSQKFKTETAKRAGVSYSTFNNWFVPGSRPPFMLIALMQSELERTEMHEVLTKFRDVTWYLENL